MGNRYSSPFGLNCKQKEAVTARGRLPRPHASVGFRYGPTVAPKPGSVKIFLVGVNVNDIVVFGFYQEEQHVLFEVPSQ